MSVLIERTVLFTTEPAIAEVKKKNALVEAKLKAIFDEVSRTFTVPYY